MREKVLYRMEQEIKDYRGQLVSGAMTAGEIVEQAYQLVIKQGLFQVFEDYRLTKLSMEEWVWLDGQENILNYLYELWIHADVDLTEEFAELILGEVDRDREVHGNE